MRALVIEDDPDLRAQIAKYFADEGFVVDAAADGEQGLYMATEYPVDLAIVDLGLPKVSGVDIVKQARKKGLAYPILILTARDGWENKVAGLEAGADDYLVSHFTAKSSSRGRARCCAARAAGRRRRWSPDPSCSTPAPSPSR
jgi:two-component system, OmpR family, response regulator PhoP